MKRLCVICLCLFLSIGCFAQDADSLDQLKKRIYAHYYQSEFSEVVECGREALEVFEANNDLFDVAGCYNVMGNAYQRLGQFKEAIECYERCTETMEQLKASEDEGSREDAAAFYDKNIRYTRNNIAEIHTTLGEYDEAEKLYRNCVEMLGEPTDTIDFLDLSVYLQNLAGVGLKQAVVLEGDEKQQRLASAVEMAEQAYALSEQYGDKPFKRVNKTFTLAQAYFAIGRTNEGLALANKALDMAKAQDDPYLQAEIHAILGGFEAQLGKYAAAERHYRTAMDIAEENGFDELLMTALNGGYESAKQFDLKLALDYFERSTAIKDSIFNADQQRLLRDYQARYDLSEKEHQIALQEEKNKTIRIKFVVLSVLAVLLLVLMVVGFYVGFKRKRQNAALANINKSKDHLLSVVSHDFKTSVGSQNLMLDAMYNSLEKMPMEQLKDKVFMLKTSSDALYEKMFHLFEWMKLELGSGATKHEAFDLLALVQDCVKAQETEIHQKGIEVVADIDEGMIAMDNKTMVRLVMQNVIGNAVKFSWPHSQVNIKATQESARFWVEVEDHGMGMSPEKNAMVLKEVVTPSKGTNGESGTGAGLLLCAHFLERNGEKIEIESAESIGTKVRFSIKAMT